MNLSDESTEIITISCDALDAPVCGPIRNEPLISTINADEVAEIKKTSPEFRFSCGIPGLPENPKNDAALRSG
jgi:hypothetical protein